MTGNGKVRYDTCRCNGETSAVQTDARIVNPRVKLRRFYAFLYSVIADSAACTLRLRPVLTSSLRLERCIPTLPRITDARGRVVDYTLDQAGTLHEVFSNQAFSGPNR